MYHSYFYNKKNNYINIKFIYIFNIEKNIFLYNFNLILFIIYTKYNYNECSTPLYIYIYKGII